MSFSERTAMLIGEDGVQTLSKSHVAVFGQGGVGAFTTEALARAGVGTLSLFDGDVVCDSNRNRQLIALCSTLGQNKPTIMAQRIADINPACHVHAHCVYYTPANAHDFPFEQYDYIVDAVDMVSAKIEIIQRAKAANVPVISSMGAGNKLHPELFEVADIEQTSMCPLARVMRKELKKRNITGVKTVYSKEPALTPKQRDSTERTPGSISFVPSTAGLIIAGVVVRDLLCLN